MFLIYCILLFTFVYLLPGLAFFPQLICTARVAFAIPIISVLIVYAFTSILIATHHFNAGTVTVVALLLGLIAFARIKKTLQTKPFFWSYHERILYFLHFILFIPYFIKLGTHTFDRGDELYSWNFWAIQHYFQLPIDFSHTGASYPQLFPKLLAFCYHLLGSTQLQLPVRGALVLFPFSMLLAISMASSHYKKSHIAIYTLLLVYVLAGVGLSQFFNDGYADPIMTSALIVSVVLFWQGQSLNSSKVIGKSPSFSLYGFSVLCGVVCAHAKQAGLLWTLFTLPLLLILNYQKSRDKTFILLSILCFVGGFVWFLGEGSAFYQNDGVITLSLGQRNVFSQLVYATQKYFLHQPLLFLLFLTALYAGYQEVTLRRLMLFFMLPSLLLWFIFGAYQLRLGQHLIALSLFIIVASNYRLPASLLKRRIWKRYLNWYWLRHTFLLKVGTCLSLMITIGYFAKALWLEQSDLHLYAGGKQSLYRYFEEDTPYIYKNIYSNPDILVWVPSRYLYGLFYHQTQLTTPDYFQYEQYTKAALINELTQKLPDYVFTVSQNIVDGPASGVLAQVIQECPLAFNKLTTGNNKFRFVTYGVKKEIFLQDPCLIQLRSEQDVAFKG